MSLSTSGCDVSNVIEWPRSQARSAMRVPVRPVKMFVMHRTRSIGACVLPAVTRRRMRTARAETPRHKEDHMECRLLCALASLREQQLLHDLDVGQLVEVAFQGVGQPGH